MVRMLLDGRLSYRIDWIEPQLVHAVWDTHGRTYNRTAHLDGRHEMMQDKQIISVASKTQAMVKY